MIPFPDKKYNIIYADPPWSFDTYSDKGKDKSAENHYECQDLEWIKNLPVANITQDIEASLAAGTPLPAFARGAQIMAMAAMAQRGLSASTIAADEVS